jgi:RTX calcium-binding nonapeptide repeat (4 copies)
MLRSSACRRSAAGLLCALGAGLLSAGPAQAGVADQMWNCRASAAYVAIPGQDRTEPVLANGSSRTKTESPDRGRCADDDGTPVGAGAELGLQAPTATTAIHPDGGLAVDQKVAAKASVVDFAPGRQGFSLVVRGARSEAAGACTANGPAFTGSSVVPFVRFNDRALDLRALEPVVEQLPTGEVVSIKLNEQTRAGNSLVQRAVHVEVKNELGQVVREVVVAESRVSGGKEVCDRAAQEDAADDNGDGSGDGGGADDAGEPCIRGAEYDEDRNFCIITRERDNNLANGRETIAVVGKPFEGPSGGRVALPGEAPASARKSTCLKRKGVKFLVLGTKRSDRITGSNRADVIFTFGGNDKVSGGRGNDCIVGGAGNDRLGGSIGKDTLIGGRGGDNLNGGSEADKLMGGAGSDSINAAFGRDKVSGGRGADAINVATAGPAARVRCGKGKDVARFNFNERRRVKGCERRYSLR